MINGRSQIKSDLIILDVYGKDTFDQLKKYMRKYKISNILSIVMFLAAIRVESGHGQHKLEQGDEAYFKKQGYDKEVRFIQNIVSDLQRMKGIMGEL